MPKHDADVIVVGGGPVGMTIALRLASFGISVLLSDSGDGAPCVGSRAIASARWTLETLERVGCGQRIADEGVTWTVGRTYYRDSELFQITFPSVGEEHFPPFVNLGQQRVEEILLERLRDEPLVDSRWGHTLTDLSQDEAGVVATIAPEIGTPLRVRGAYLVGCDGPKSMTRELAGMTFDGYTNPDKFVIADIRAELPFPNERRFFFSHAANRGRQILIHPQPDGIWRIDWQVSADFDLERETRSGALDERILRLIGDVPYEVVWTSAYIFHQRRASSFRAGRVFLAGDAAHMFAPFGGRGMNSGVDDAENLAWKLWLRLNDLAPDSLLDSYHDERAAAADYNLALTGTTMRFMAPPSRWRRLRREAVLRGSLRFERMRKLIDSGKLSVPFEYVNSPIVDGAGEIAPDVDACVDSGSGAAPARLRTLLGRDFVLLHFGDTGEADPEATVHHLVPGAEPVAGPGVAGGGRVARAYGAEPGDVVVIRPDGHVAARSGTAGPRDFTDLVARACGGPVPTLNPIPSP